MPAATFDGPNLMITLPAPTGGLLTINAQEDIYSDWKVWVKDVGHEYEPAFGTAAGDEIPSGIITGAYFLRNDLGWRIQTTDEDQEVSIVGDLYPRDKDLPLFVARPGRTIFISVDRSASPRSLEDARIQDVHAAHMNRRTRNPATGDEVIYESDGVTPRHNFTTTDDGSQITEITPA